MIPGLVILLCVLAMFGVGLYIAVRWLCAYIARRG